MSTGSSGSVTSQIEELRVLSDRVRVLTSGTATGGRYEIFDVVGEAGAAHLGRPA